MAYRRPNRSGYDSTRNLSKAYRQPRMVTNDRGERVFHAMDMMRLGADGQAVNSTGCYGVVSTWGVGRISIYLKGNAPGKVKRPAKKKAVSKLYCGIVAFDFKKASFAQLVNLRANMLAAHQMGKEVGRDLLSSGLRKILQEVSSYLVQHYPEEMKEEFKRDKDREYSIKGMVKSGKITIQQPKSLNQRVKKALHLMRLSDEETSRHQSLQTPTFG